MYDWKKWLAPCMRKVSGFTNTPLDEPTVRGWRLQKNTSGVVEMKWKVDPAVDTEWRGLNGLPASDGFHIFKYQPQGIPELIEPATNILLESYRTQLKSRLMIATMAAEGTPDAVMYNYEAAQHGEIKKFLMIEEPPLYGEWGGCTRLVPSTARFALLKNYGPGARLQTGGVWAAIGARG